MLMDGWSKETLIRKFQVLALEREEFIQDAKMS
jgi:hypothetical protein